MLLRHLPLPAPTTYQRATQLNDLLFARLLASKAEPHGRRPRPPPTVLTFTPPPTYTFGRPRAGRASPRSRARPTARPSACARWAPPSTPPRAAARPPSTGTGASGPHVPESWTPARHGLRARAYVRLLEETRWSPARRPGFARGGGRGGRGLGFDPVAGRRGRRGDEGKIGAVGVRLRRSVAGHGVALNVGREPLTWFDEIVACGLEDVKSTSLVVEGAAEGTTVAEVGDAFVRELASRLKGVDEVEVASEQEAADELSEADRLYDQSAS